MDGNLENPAPNSPIHQTSSTSVLLQIFSLLIIVVLFFLALNYLNLLPISKTFPFLSFLPTKSSGGPGSCKVLEEKFCSKAELLERKAADGTLVRGIGINLPSGTPIFSNLDSTLVKTELKGEVKGFNGSIGGTLAIEPGNPNFDFTGDIKFNNMVPQRVKKGDVIGHIGNIGSTILGYTITITIPGLASENAQNVDKFLKPMFPRAFQKPARRME